MLFRWGGRSLRPLLHMEMWVEGVLICRRGDCFRSVAMTEEHLARARDALERFIGRYKPLILEVLEA